MLIRLFTPEPIFVEIVGVVEHQRNGTLAAEGRETVYFPSRFAGSWNNMSWALRTVGDPQRQVAGVRAALEELDPLIPISDVRPMTEYVDGAMAPTRFALVLIGIFGLTALLLASIGLYGVLAYAVRQRTPEIGLRMAFGARGSSILRMVVAEGLRLAVLGVVLGLGAAIALTRILSSLLVGVAPTDAVTYAAVATIFLAIAALACYAPAWRATRVDPLVALRED
jgi:ABC-type antimicrobial peptide transport system permease subunit